VTVNDWIRTGGAFDNVIDFDAVVRDPQHPARILPTYDKGDHLHPNAAGYKAMAESVDLGLLIGNDEVRAVRRFGRASDGVNREASERHAVKNSGNAAGVSSGASSGR